MSLVICSNKLESSNPYDRFGQDQSPSNRLRLIKMVLLESQVTISGISFLIKICEPM